MSLRSVTLWACFAATALISAVLLQWVLPMTLKIILPRFGVDSGILDTASLAYTAALLAAFVYAYLLCRFAPPRVQVAVHLVAWLGLLLFVMLLWPQGDEVAWAQGIGAIVLPGFFCTANIVLAMHWSCAIRAGSGARPYALFAVSSVGSLVGLVGYLLSV